MKQPFGIDFSAEDVASVFATCISCFNYALDRAPNDEDALRLSLVRLRLTRWGKAVNIYKESGREEDCIDVDDIEEVNRILVDMMAMFEVSSGSTQETAKDLTSKHPTNVGQSAQALLSMLETIASERSGGKSLLFPESFRFGRWPTSFVEYASKFVTKLEDYIPAGPEQRKLCAAEKMRFEEAGNLEFLDSIANEMDDPWMSNGIPFSVGGNIGIVVGVNSKFLPQRYGKRLGGIIGLDR